MDIELKDQLCLLLVIVWLDYNYSTYKRSRSNISDRYVEQTWRNILNADPYISNVIWIYYIAGDIGTIGVLGYNVSDIIHNCYSPQCFVGELISPFEF